MTLEDFETLLDRLGGDVARWPADDRVAARAMLQTSPEAREALATMQSVEQFLSRSRPVATADGMMAAQAIRRRQVTAPSRLAIRAGWSTAAAALLLIGIVVGANGGHGDDDPGVTLSAAFTAPDVFDVD